MSVPAIIAVDIDGTLIGSHKRIPRFTRDEIHRVVREYGTRLFIVTARGPESTAVIEEELGVHGSYATFGGALVWARKDDGSFTTLRETPIPEEVVAGILNASSGLDVHSGVYSREDWYVSSLDYWGLREARNTAVWPTVTAIDSTLLGRVGPIFKVMFRGETQDLTRLEQLLAPFASRAYIHNSGRVLEIISSDAVKLPAVQQLCMHFGLALEDVISFGDSAADVEMLEGCGIGVLMGNARPELVVAGHVERTLSNDEDGIGMSLRKHFPTDALFRP